MNKQYTLIMNYRYVNFEIEYSEKTKVTDFHSNDLNELVNILNQYVNGFLSKEKKPDSWMFFNAEIRNNKLSIYNLEYVAYKVLLKRRD